MVVKNLSYKQLLRSWVMRLANHLAFDGGLERSKALRMAHMTAWVLEDLGEGKVVFYYRKEDGTVRRAVGTLCKNVCPEYDKALNEWYANLSERSYETRDNSNTEGIYTYWDIEKKGFRTFKAKNLITIIESVNVNEL